MITTKTTWLNTKVIVYLKTLILVVPHLFEHLAILVRVNTILLIILVCVPEQFWRIVNTKVIVHLTIVDLVVPQLFEPLAILVRANTILLPIVVHVSVLEQFW